jgi:hypothetical protein
MDSNLAVLTMYEALILIVLIINILVTQHQLRLEVEPDKVDMQTIKETELHQFLNAYDERH